MGLSFGEIVVLAVLALVVIGPKDLPRLLRSAGRMIGQAKRAIADVKRETGLDEVLRGDFRDLERLADHIEELGESKPGRPVLVDGEPPGFRLREYPPIGADSVLQLPEDADVYPETTPLAHSSERVPTILGSPPAPETSRAEKAAS